MTVTTEPDAAAPRAPWPLDAQRLLLHNVAWEQYGSLLQALDDRHVRLTYDHGNLEFMTLSAEHERYKHLLRRLIEVLGEEAGVSMQGLGSTTYRRADLERGLEPDECYYIQSWPQVRGKKRIDLTVDPPPDLVVEIDVTHSSLDRMTIYAALGVPEVWRFDGEALRVYRLSPEGRYAPTDYSPTFPALPLTEFARFVQHGATADELSMIRTFRTWVREQLDAKR